MHDHLDRDRTARWRMALMIAVLAGCVPSSQEVRAPVDRVVRERLGAAVDPVADAQIDRLLAQPLDAGVATRIALANNARLHAAFDELDIAAGDVAAALGLGPVAIDAKLRFGSPHDEVELEAVQSVLGLVFAPSRRAAAHAELRAVSAAAAAMALRLAARVEIGFADVLAAQQELELRRTAFDAADAAATLRERMHAAGNTTDLALARDRDAREQARLDLGRAELALTSARNALSAMLGLSGDRTKWAAAGALRDLPTAPPAVDGLEATAVAASLELTAGRERREAAERRASAERLRAVVPELGIGVAVADDGHQTGIGPALRIGIPLLDLRSGERARANARVRREAHTLAAEESELRAAAQTASAAARATYEEARRLRDVVLPLRQQIVSETLKHYNAMDVDPFELIIARRELVDGTHQYVDALRRYWNAVAEVSALSRGVMLSSPASPTPTQEAP
ncbi:MAG TPA: TolC family protein [Kofleriaceae bacterium]|nr:TolC family protein [Kofleriaceae bacterium]